MLADINLDGSLIATIVVGILIAVAIVAIFRKF